MIWCNLCFKCEQQVVGSRNGNWSVKPRVCQTMAFLWPESCFCTPEPRLVFTFLKGCLKKNKDEYANRDYIQPTKPKLFDIQEEMMN